MITPSNIKRFWKYVAVTDGCWGWNGEIIHNGYGRMGFNNKHILAHRFSWMLHYGDIPNNGSYHGNCILHRCDNRSCCNPAHLFVGTHQDNMTDREMKNRGVALCGSANSSSKLTNAQVETIIQNGKFGTYEAIALNYGVTRHTISKILNGTAWRHTRASMEKGFIHA